MLHKSLSKVMADVLKKPCHRHLTALKRGLPAFCQKAQTVKNAATCTIIKSCRFAGVLKHVCHIYYATLNLFEFSSGFRIKCGMTEKSEHLT
jgi:hypothetical protein